MKYMCKGTANLEDVYFIPVENIKNINLFPNASWIKHKGGLIVDKCIGSKIEDLLMAGVISYGCCCGHGEQKPVALINPMSLEIATFHGYTDYEKFRDLLEISLIKNNGINVKE